MKVAFLSSSFHGGAGSSVYAKQFVEKLSEHRDVDRVLIVTKADRPVDEFHGQKIINIPARMPSHLKRYEFGARCMGYAGSLKKEGVDVVHAEHSFEGLLADKCKKKYGMPFVYVREVVSKDMPSFYMKHVLFNIEKYLTEHLDYDILVSWTKNMVDNYFSKWKVDQSKIRIIPGAIDTDYFNNKTDCASIRPEHGIGENDFLLLSAKIFSSSNMAGLLMAVRAFAEFSKTRPNAKYIICGRGNGKPLLESEIKKLGLRNRVKILENVQSRDLLHFYRSADATVQLFLYEASISVSMMESLACGTPVITTPIGETPNVIEGNLRKIMVNPAVHDVARAMAYLCDNPEERGKIAIESRKLAEEKFNMRKGVDRYVKMYKKLLEGK